MMRLHRRSTVAAALVLAALGLGACQGRDEALDRIGKALGSCDDTAACAAAVAELRSLDRPRRDSPAGIEARLKALRVSLAAQAAWPEPDRAFLQGAGLEPERALSLLEEEARAVESLGAPGAGATDVRGLLAAYREPSCARVETLESIESAGGRFADVAWLVRANQMAQLVGSVEALRVQAHAEFARLLLGCRLPADATDAEVLLDARGRLEDAVAACPKAAGAVVQVRKSCERLATDVAGWALPLPFPGIPAGELAGALLPAGRGYGFAFTPPWVLVLSAGRLVLAEQPTVPAGAKVAREAEPVVLIDLRRSHRALDVRYAIAQALKGREPPQVRSRTFLPLAVDRAATWADLVEVLDAAMAETDLVPAVATLPSGVRTPTFVPVNWRYSTRPLMDPWGVRLDFKGNADVVDLSLNPFALTIRAGGAERQVEVLAASVEGGARRPTLRAAYGALVEMMGEGPARPARLVAAGTTSVGLLLTVVETLAARLPEGALSSEGLFATATPVRERGGAPVALLPAIVLRGPDMPPE